MTFAWVRKLKLQLLQLSPTPCTKTSVNHNGTNSFISAIVWFNFAYSLPEPFVLLAATGIMTTWASVSHNYWSSCKTDQLFCTLCNTDQLF